MDKEAEKIFEKGLKDIESIGYRIIDICNSQLMALCENNYGYIVSLYYDSSAHEMWVDDRKIYDNRLKTEEQKV